MGGLAIPQHLTMLMFREIIRQQFPLEKETSTNKNLPPPSGEEENALRYAAGYVCQNMWKKLEGSSYLLKEEHILSTIDLLDDNDDKEGSCETWLNSIDRGGLRHISDTTFIYTLSFFFLEVLWRLLTNCMIHIFTSATCMS